MSLGQFLSELAEHGRVTVKPTANAPWTPRRPRCCSGLNVAATRNLAFTAPAFSLPAAAWAAVMFYGACQFVVCRDRSEQDLIQALARPCPEPRSPETDYSVDLIFRYLPGLPHAGEERLRRRPAGQRVDEAGARLAAVVGGLEGVGQVELDSFLGHAALRQLYVDRILATKDVARLATGGWTRR